MAMSPPHLLQRFSHRIRGFGFAVLASLSVLAPFSAQAKPEDKDLFQPNVVLKGYVVADKTHLGGVGSPVNITMDHRVLDDTGHPVNVANRIINIQNINEPLLEQRGFTSDRIKVVTTTLGWQLLSTNAQGMYTGHISVPVKHQSFQDGFQQLKTSLPINGKRTEQSLEMQGINYDVNVGREGGINVVDPQQNNSGINIFAGKSGNIIAFGSDNKGGFEGVFNLQAKLHIHCGKGNFRTRKEKILVVTRITNALRVSSTALSFFNGSPQIVFSNSLQETNIFIDNVPFSTTTAAPAATPAPALALAPPQPRNIVTTTTRPPHHLPIVVEQTLLHKEHCVSCCPEMVTALNNNTAALAAETAAVSDLAHHIQSLESSRIAPTHTDLPQDRTPPLALLAPLLVEPPSSSPPAEQNVPAITSGNRSLLPPRIAAETLLTKTPEAQELKTSWNQAKKIFAQWKKTDNEVAKATLAVAMESALEQMHLSANIGFNAEPALMVKLSSHGKALSAQDAAAKASRYILRKGALFTVRNSGDLLDNIREAAAVTLDRKLGTELQNFAVRATKKRIKQMGNSLNKSALA